MDSRSSSNPPVLREESNSVFRNEKKSRAQRLQQREKRIRVEEYRTQKTKNRGLVVKQATECPLSVVSTENLTK